MLYRILALTALFFFTACGGGPRDIEPQTRKPVGQGYPASAMPLPDVQPIPPAEGERVVKIGLLVPMTGNASAAGTALMEAATLALMDKYGHTEAGSQKVRVVLVPKDTQGTPAGATAAAQQVLAAGAQLIVGPLFSTNVEPVAAAARQYGVNVLTFSNNPEVAGGNVFVFGFQVEQQVRRVLNYALNRNLTRPALLAPNNAYGASVRDSATALMRASGLRLADERYYNPATTAQAEIEQLVASNATVQFDSILIPEGGQKLEQIVRALRAGGITQPNTRFLGTGLWDEPEVLRSGTLAGGWFASSSPDRFTAYERRFREYFGYAPPRISALAYDAMALAASLAINAPEGAAFSTAALTDRAGYNGPVNGIFRCLPDGVCERGLAVLEVTGTGTARVIDAAPRSF